MSDDLVLLDVPDDRPPVNVPPPVLAAGKWGNNAEMIVDVAKIWPLDGLTVDVTFGKGAFWSLLTPELFVAHDLDPEKGDGVDWRALPESSGSVTTLVFDPPYVAPGGRETSTIDSMNDAYGMLTTEKDPAAQWAKIIGGFTEAARVVKVGGRLWFKVMNYVEGGDRWHFTRMAYDEMDAVGFDVVDEFVLVGGPGPQPKVSPSGKIRNQEHARNNYSTLIIGQRRPDPHPTLFDP